MFEPSKSEYLPWKYERNSDDSLFGRLSVAVASVKVKCTEGEKGLTCTMGFNVFAYINSTRQRDKNGSPIVPESHVYGHEQRHFANILAAGFELAKALSVSGEKKISVIEKEYSKRLMKIFEDEQTHDKAVTGNPNTPGAQEPIAPLNPEGGDWSGNQMPQKDDF
jgi:hypothetical protein